MHEHIVVWVARLADGLVDQGRHLALEGAPCAALHPLEGLRVVPRVAVLILGRVVAEHAGVSVGRGLRKAEEAVLAAPADPGGRVQLPADEASGRAVGDRVAPALVEEVSRPARPARAVGGIPERARIVAP